MTIYDDDEIRNKDKAAKEKMEEYADSKSNVKECNIKVGDSVLVKQPRLNKLTTPFNPIRHTVMEKRGSMITAVSDVTDKRITRNTPFFKKISPEVRKDDIKKDTITNILNVEHLGGSINNGTVPHIIDIADVEDVETENLNEEETENVAGNEVPPRRNPIRERRRPSHLRDDIEHLLSN